MPVERAQNRTQCPLSNCMEFIGGAWTPMILFHLCASPRRFSELRADIPLISAKVLTQRLRDLEQRGILSRKVTGSSPPSVEYALTALGHEFTPVIQAIAEVGQRLKSRAAARALPGLSVLGEAGKLA
jgi:DNA-binding HxlR family transcriptional regulator